MPYKITFEPLNRIKGVRSAMVERDTAAEALVTVRDLMAGDERVSSIVDPDGRTIDWRELQARATAADQESP